MYDQKYLKKMYNEEPKEIIKKRLNYFEQYLMLPPPTPKTESWKYSGIEEDPASFTPISQKIEFFGSKNAIFIDLKTAMKEHPEIIIKHLLSQKSEDKYMALHSAFFDDGVFIYLPKNTDAVLKNKFTVTGKGGIMSHTLIIMEENSSLVYTEEHCSEKGSYLAIRNDAVEAFLGDNSRLRFQSFRNWEDNVISISYWSAKAVRDAKADWLFSQAGGKFSRISIKTDLDGPGSCSEAYGMFYGKKDQKFDFTTDIFHNTPNTMGNILVKGVLDDKAEAVFRGKIKISKDAQNTNSYMADHTLMLGEGAISNSIPSLEIDADDVSASHGATLGRPNEKEIFYMMSRGIKRKDAEKLVVQGFLSEITEKIEDDEVKEKIMQVIR
ncbi:Fe-S cluster assembly protein SufD [Candidatus Woesearchaeota archaeon]|nr:Fe-S cluster assembly protein SufD [Candidatus Woesearchaeota archaeon]